MDCKELFENVLDESLNSPYVLISFSGPPVNVTCNIFINSFGSIAETTMVGILLCNKFHARVICNYINGNILCNLKPKLI